MTWQDANLLRLCLICGAPDANLLRIADSRNVRVCDECLRHADNPWTSYEVREPLPVECLPGDDGDMVSARAEREGRDVVSLVCCLWIEWGEVAIISKLREQEVIGVSDEDLSVLLQCGSGRLLYSLAKHARDMELLTVEMLTAPVMVPMFARTV